jgi:Tfp pilus assembly protein PilO
MNARQALRGNWLVTIPLVGLTIIYVAAFDVPQRRAKGQLKDELAASQAFVASGPAIMAQIAERELQLRRTNEFVASWRERSPSGGGTAVMLGEISRLAREAGTQTTRLEPASPIEHEQMRSMPLTLACRGSLKQVFALLRGIEGLPQSIWCEDLRIERKEAKSDVLSCELKLVVFADKSEISD